MRTIQLTFAAAVLLIVGYWLYMVSDYIVLWSRRAAFLAGQGVRWGGLLLLLLAAFGCAAYLLRQRDERLRQRDGAWAAEYHPLVVGPKRLWLWLLGKPAPRVRVDGNAAMTHALAIDAAGVHEFAPAAGWDRQAAYMADQERTNRLRALAGRGDGGLPKIPNIATGRFLTGALDGHPRPAVTVERPAEPLQLPAPDLTPADAVSASRPASLVLGQTDGGELVRWDMAQTPHLRFHGATRGAGKTNAIQVVAAGALNTGAHVVVFDPAHFKDWGDFRHCAELVDASDPATLADGAARLMTIYHNRTRQLAEAGRRNIGEMTRPPQRIVVVICEFGAQCELARAEGVMGEIETNLLQLARKAAAAGIHLVLEDQAVERWPRALSANVAGTAIGRMPLYAAQACGFVARRGMTTETLERGQFWFGGQLLRTPHMQPELRTLLASVPAPRRLVMLTPRWEGSSQPVHGAVHGAVQGSLPEVDPPPTPAVNTPMNTTPTTVEGWYEWTIDNYLPMHPELLQTDDRGRGMGVKALAETMAAENGKGMDAMKGTASEVAKRLRADVGFVGGAGEVFGVNDTGGKKGGA